MDKATAHPNCREGHVCQKPSGRPCIERGCYQPAGTLWGPLWCPAHDEERLNRITTSLHNLAEELR